MSICGLVVHAKPGLVGSVQASMEAMKGVEVHQATGDGRLVVTVDNPDEYEAGDILNSFRDIKGVLSTSLVYAHFEEDYVEGEHAS
ncbi:MAG: chaperone NapD [Alphaproteobacteria bacterium]|nr:chaperone NapD [Alphaproteobacteria bacterium]